MNNPFTIYFGKTPDQFIARLSQTNGIIETFKGDKPSSQVYMITGVRGCGKTVMLTDVANAFRNEQGWIVLELNPERDMLMSLAASLYAIPELHKLFLKAKLDFSALGLGVSIENAAPVTDVENAVDRMLENIKKSGKRLLITVDEVTNNEYVRVLAASFQIFIRKDYPVFMLMTGLYENIYDLQNVKSLTFLYRAPKVFLEPLNYTAIVSRYKKVFKIANEEAEEMAVLTKGYAYAFQILGYLKWEKNNATIEDLLPYYDQYLEEYVYSKIWSELSENDKRVIVEMSRTGETKVTAIREGLGMTTPEFSVYRDRLKRKGLINTDTYGHISIILPRFDKFALSKTGM